LAHGPGRSLLDGVPFAALPDLSQHDTPLITSHSLRSIPSELLLLSPKATEPEPRFLGIADPIYNLADSRRARKGIFTQAKQEAGGITLARLVGSDREVRSAANSSALTNTQFLLGVQASGAVLRDALTPVPEIVHFAVHVVSPPGQPQQAALALSLTKDNVAELLTPEVIAAYRVPGSLVVLSGCASEQGKTLPSAGLLGLSRAWLLAGAAAVLVSSWPTPDDSGQFFSVFYRYFQMIKSGPLALRAAIALKQTQLEMQRGSGYRSSPSFWAAYSIISKE
jgi:CHAT domain-containing protein